MKPLPVKSRSASATGPILPSSVESKVEQYLKKRCSAPAFSQSLRRRKGLRDGFLDGNGSGLQRTTTASAL